MRDEHDNRGPGIVKRLVNTHIRLMIAGRTEVEIPLKDSRVISIIWYKGQKLYEKAGFETMDIAAEPDSKLWTWQKWHFTKRQKKFEKRIQTIASDGLKHLKRSCIYETAASSLKHHMRGVFLNCGK